MLIEIRRPEFFGLIYFQDNFNLLILKELKILEKDQSNQKFEVYPVTGV